MNREELIKKAEESGRKKLAEQLKTSTDEELLKALSSFESFKEDPVFLEYVNYVENQWDKLEVIINEMELSNIEIDKLLANDDIRETLQSKLNQANKETDDLEYLKEAIRNYKLDQNTNRKKVKKPIDRITTTICNSLVLQKKSYSRRNKNNIPGQMQMLLASQEATESFDIYEAENGLSFSIVFINPITSLWENVSISPQELHILFALLNLTLENKPITETSILKRLNKTATQNTIRKLIRNTLLKMENTYIAYSDEEIGKMHHILNGKWLFDLKVNHKDTKWQYVPDSIPTIFAIGIMRNEITNFDTECYKYFSFTNNNLLIFNELLRRVQLKTKKRFKGNPIVFSNMFADLGITEHQDRYRKTFLNMLTEFKNNSCEIGGYVITFINYPYKKDPKNKNDKGDPDRIDFNIKRVNIPPKKLETKPIEKITD